MKRMSCVEIFNTLFEKTDTDSANNYELTKALSLYSLAASMATLADVMASREKKGHWVKVNALQEDDGGSYKCSECGWGHPSITRRTKFCPFCGAKMEVDE